MNGAYFFKSPEEIPGLFDGLFGGIFVTKSIPVLLQMAVFFSVFFGIALAYSQTVEPTRVKKRILWGLGSLLFVSIFFMTIAPWDELFINLRHSLHLATEGRFSFNKTEWIEGTVDFLPYGILGLLHRIGVPLIEGAFILSLLGGIGCWLVGYRMLRFWKIPNAESWAPLVLLAQIPLLYNSSQGFTASLFAACQLWALYFIFLERRIVWGFLLLSLVPLIRTEGIWFLSITCALYGKRNGIRSLAWGLLSIVPFLFLCGLRLHWFGSVISTPIKYKNTTGSFFFLLIGVRNVLTDLVAGYSASVGSLILICAAQWKKLHPRGRLFDKTQIDLLLVFVLFEIPYYLSGGDWFPPHWERYLFPFSFYLWVLGLAAFAKTWVDAKERSPLFLAAVLFVFFMPFLWTNSGYRRLMSDLFRGRAVLAKVQSRYWAHARMQLLSQLGNHLKRTSEPNQKIASSEVASIMFFAEREAVDLLGVANPRIAARPLRTPPPLFRKYPRSELPYSIFRRVDPTIVPELRPEYLYLFDFNVKDLFEDFQTKELDERTLFVALDRWQRKFVGLIAPIYGSVEKLVAEGYFPIVVASGNEFCNLYFVSKEALPGHLQKLKQSGFTGEWLNRR
jgi:hypothetical protein